MSIVKKLMHYGVTRENAEALVAAGYISPKLIREAVEEDIVELIGSYDADDLLTRLGV